MLRLAAEPYAAADFGAIALLFGRLPCAAEFEPPAPNFGMQTKADQPEK
jgi:hypothetical protein